MRPFIIIATLGIAHGVGQPLHAEPLATVSLHYHRADSAESCPDEQALRRGVAARLGREPFRDDSKRSLTVQLAGVGSGFSADITVRDLAGTVVGTRSLRTREKDCAELASSMELAIAIAIDPLYNMPRAQVPQPAEAIAAPAVATEPEPVVTAPAPSPAAPAPPPPLPEAARKYLGAGLLMGGSTEPAPTMGLTAHYKQRDASLAWAIEGRLDLPRTTEFGGGNIDTALVTVASMLCLPRGAWDACGVIGLGFLRSEGRRYAESQSAMTPHAAAGGRLAYGIGFSRSFGLEFGADLLVRLHRTALLVDDREAWQSSPFEISAGVRGAWRLD